MIANSLKETRERKKASTLAQTLIQHGDHIIRFGEMRKGRRLWARNVIKSGCSRTERNHALPNKRSSLVRPWLVASSLISQRDPCVLPSARSHSQRLQRYSSCCGVNVWRRHLTSCRAAPDRMDDGAVLIISHCFMHAQKHE